jgi:formate C-acetyltransferase
MYFYSIASFVDSVCAVKKFVFDEKRFTFEELGEILKSNWTANPKLRAEALRISEKYGNSNPTADEVTVWISDFCANLVNNKPNGRGGVFKAALFSINHCYPESKNVMATPEGRLAGDPISKNLCASTAQDKNGITALINSVTKIDHAAFPTGSVLDVVIHPSAVSGEDGLDAFLGILKTYIARGGYALHGNVFDANQLRRAQREPEKYKNLQVRVCGWNSYFLNLSPEEQDAFIRQAENAGC